jgi:teichuronic acid biosynthesis glycosyltransferase TuaG
MQPLVSVVTPAYNSSTSLSQTIESVLSQSYTNLEYLIVDDGSSDTTSDIILKYSCVDKRIRSIHFEKNQGVSNARNKAIEMAKGKYLSFLDSDDWWVKDKLEKQIGFMINNDYAFSFTSYYLASSDGSYNNSVIIRAPQSIDYFGLLKKTEIGCLTVVLDLEKIGKFKMPILQYGQDSATWLKILKGGVVAYGFDEPLAYYRRKPGLFWGTTLQTLKTKWGVYRQIEKLPWYAALNCFIQYAIYATMKRIAPSLLYVGKRK